MQTHVEVRGQSGVVLRLPFRRVFETRSLTAWSLSSRQAVWAVSLRHLRVFFPAVGFQVCVTTQAARDRTRVLRLTRQALY